MTIAQIVNEMREYSDPHSDPWRWADTLEAAMREPVATVVKNDSGQIRLVGKDWLALDLSAHVGTNLYEIPPDAAAEIERLREALQSLRSDLREPAEREDGLFRHFYDRVQTALAEGKP